jgi:hypothetical protein
VLPLARGTSFEGCQTRAWDIVRKSNAPQAASWVSFNRHTTHTEASIIRSLLRKHNGDEPTEDCTSSLSLGHAFVMLSLMPFRAG